MRKKAILPTSLPAANAGFTLIEILIVMIIIGILAVLGAGSFQSSQKKSRDTTRKADLRQISNALELYYNDKGVYPQATLAHTIAGCANETECDWGDVFQDENNTVYMVKLPLDPKPNLEYYYASDGSYYQIYARLENELDPDIPSGVGGVNQNYGVSCGAANCNYGIGSTNITPEEGRSMAND